MRTTTTGGTVGQLGGFGDVTLQGSLVANVPQRRVRLYNMVVEGDIEVSNGAIVELAE